MRIDVMVKDETSGFEQLEFESEHTVFTRIHQCEDAFKTF